MATNQKLRQAKIAKWVSLINDQASSGLKVTDWCKQNNISKHAYFYWKRIIKEEYVQSILPDIVPIGPVSDKPSVYEESVLGPIESHDLRNSRNLCNPGSYNPASISVSMGDIRIEIGPSASDQLIASIIKAVRDA